MRSMKPVSIVRDSRADDVQEMLAGAQGDLLGLNRFVLDLPPHMRSDARCALAQALRAGRTLGELATVGAKHVDPESLPLVGAELREHLRHWRDLHAEILATEKIAAKVTGRHVGEMSSRHDAIAA